MSKNLRIAIGVAAAFGGLAVLHIWQNVGFENVGLGRKQTVDEAAFRVGFLPVT